MFDLGYFYKKDLVSLIGAVPHKQFNEKVSGFINSQKNCIAKIKANPYIIYALHEIILFELHL